MKNKNYPALENCNKTDVGEENAEDLPPNLDRARCRGNRMSVSRSGRFKQRSHCRSALFDNPNLAAKKCENASNKGENDENSVPSSDDDGGIKRSTVTENGARRNPASSVCKELPLQSAV